MLTADIPGNARAQRRYLRECTREVHAALEDLPLMRRLMSPQVRFEDYRLLLRAFYRAYLPLCERLQDRLGPWADDAIAPQQLARLLRRDVLALPGAPPLPLRAMELPALPSPDAALGAWYVLEGSAMGGVVVARHLRRHLRMDLPTAYMDRRAADSQRRWKHFETHFLRCLEREAQIDAVIDGARDAYALTARSIGAR